MDYEMIPRLVNNNPLGDLTFIALEYLFFSFSRLKKASVGCLTFETAVENSSLKALSACLSSSDCPLSILTGVSISIC